jgi:hypothetical protein
VTIDQIAQDISLGANTVIHDFLPMRHLLAVNVLLCSVGLPRLDPLRNGNRSKLTL